MCLVHKWKLIVYAQSALVCMHSTTDTDIQYILFLVVVVDARPLFWSLLNFLQSSSIRFFSEPILPVREPRVTLIIGDRGGLAFKNFNFIFFLLFFKIFFFFLNLGFQKFTLPLFKNLIKSNKPTKEKKRKTLVYWTIDFFFPFNFSFCYVWFT